MDYEEALDRLERPRNKSQKTLATRLVLRKTRPEQDQTDIALRYFATDILTWSPDGGVRIDSGWFLASRCTREKINEYLPKGWRLWTHDTAFSKRHFVATIGDYGWNGKEWASTWAVPYATRVWYKHGSASHVFTKFNAASMLKQAADYVKNCAQALLDGRLSKDTVQHKVFDQFVNAWETVRGEAREHLILETLAEESNINMATVASVIRFVNQRHHFVQKAESYWKEYFEYTDAKKDRTQKGLIARVAFEMKHEGMCERYKKNSKEYAEFRNDLLFAGETLFLEGLGFEIHEKKRFERSHR